MRSASRVGSVPHAVETLEQRTLLAATPAAVTAAVVEGVLRVIGTKKADVMFVGYGGTSDTLVVRSGAAAAVVGSFHRSTFGDAVLIDGRAGHDRIIIDSAVTLPLVLLGGAGNDFIAAGSGDDILDGGKGIDRLFGGPGDDAIDGGAGNDHLDGGAGDDSLSGGRGKDAVTGGAGTDLFDDDLPREVLDKAADEILTGPVVLVVGRRR